MERDRVAPSDSCSRSDWPRQLQKDPEDVVPMTPVCVWMMMNGAVMYPKNPHHFAFMTPF